MMVKDRTLFAVLCCRLSIHSIDSLLGDTLVTLHMATLCYVDEDFLTMKVSCFE